MFVVTEWHQLEDDTQFRAHRQGYDLIGRVFPHPDGYVSGWVIKNRFGAVVASGVGFAVIYPTRNEAVQTMCTAADAAFEKVAHLPWEHGVAYEAPPTKNKG